ncbi:MAG TPA: SgcJ/EcaC family oxidoreductase [Bradyrhizobium sp.]|jgi:conserved hypothetical protein
MTGNAAARAAIEARVAALEATWNEHDAVAFTEGFAEDVDFTNVFGITLRGRAAITASHAAIFKGMFSASTLAITETCIRFIHDDIAAIDARWEMTGARDPMGNPWPKRHGLMSMIAAHADGAWRFVVFHNQDLMPPERVAEIGKALGQARG